MYASFYSYILFRAFVHHYVIRYMHPVYNYYFFLCRVCHLTLEWSECASAATRLRTNTADTIRFGSDGIGSDLDAVVRK